MASTRLVVMSISKSEPLFARRELEDAFDGDAAQGQIARRVRRSVEVRPGT